MIYIIAGIAKAGKSYVAREMNLHYHIPFMSTDYIMMMLHNSKLHNKLDIYEDDTEVAKQIQPYVEGMIQAILDNDESFILEGVHFTTNFINKLLHNYPNKIHAVYLGFKDQTVEDKMKELKDYEASINNKWYLHMNDIEFKELIEYLISESTRVYHECLEYGIPYIEIDDIVDQQEAIINTLLK